MEQRIQKLFSGICSRRKAEAYLTAGRVTVNGVPAVLGQRADPERDVILLDGRPLPEAEKKIVLLLNKPRGYVTTLSDERGRRTVAELVKDCGVRVFPVGRLDRDSEGLLLLTNDGELSQHLTHPGGEIEKVYHVSVQALDTGQELDTGAAEKAAKRLSAIRQLDGEAIRPAKVVILRREAGTTRRKIEIAQQKENRIVLSVTIHEGKNRQIRRMCEACGLRVTRLIRVREHNLTLGNLKSGAWRYLEAEEIAALWK